MKIKPAIKVLKLVRAARKHYEANHEWARGIGSVSDIDCLKLVERRLGAELGAALYRKHRDAGLLADVLERMSPDHHTLAEAIAKKLLDEATA